MAPAGYALGIDFGTSNTVAVLRHLDGRVESLLFDSSPLLISAVFADPEGPLLTGRDAAHSARTRPDCFEPNPKRRIDDGTVLLGVREIPVSDLVAAVLARVLGEARRVAGRVPEDVVLTHPVSWGPRRLRMLRQAAATAGLPGARLLPEPVAAAHSFLALPDTALEPGQTVVVYDLGGGTFDASVVRRTADGFTVLGSEGLSDLGGLDIDAAVFAYLGAVLGTRDVTAWNRLEAPVTAGDRRAARLLWDDIRTAKEMLSRASTADLHVPLLGDEVPVGREQLDRLARPLLERTVVTTRTALREARVTDVAALFLVGGSSRTPLAATLLFQRFGVAPTVVESPELVVARGSLLAGRPSAPRAPGSTTPVTPRRRAARRTPSKRRRWSLRARLGGAAVALLAVVASVALVLSDEESGTSAAAPLASGSPTTSAASTPRPVAAAGSAPRCGRALAFLGAQTGASYARGVAVSRGARLAVERYNAEHASCPVTLKVFDSRAEPDLAATRAKEIVADPAVVGVVGPVTSAETFTAAPILDAAGLPLVSPTATAPTLTGKGWSVFHRVLAPDAVHGDSAAAFLATTLGLTSAYVVDDGSEYGTALGRSVRDALGDRLAGSGTVRTGQTDFSTVVKAIVASEAPAVYYAGYSGEAARLRTQLTAAGGRSVTMVGGSGLLSDDFVRTAGAAADGTLITCGCRPVAEVPGSFRSAYVSAYAAEPELYAAEAYDATSVLLAGLDAGKTGRRDLLAATDAYRGTGLTKTLAFDADGEIVAPPVWAYRVEGGKVVALRQLT